MIPYLYIFWKSEREVTQLCLTHYNPQYCNLPGSSVHGIFQARIQEWVAISFSRGSSQPQPRDQTQVYLHCRRTPYHLSHQGIPYVEMITTMSVVYICHHIVTKTPFLCWDILRFTFSKSWGKQCNIINIIIMLYITSPSLTHCITKKVTPFYPFPHFTHPPSPCFRQPPICFLYSWTHFFFWGRGIFSLKSHISYSISLFFLTYFTYCNIFKLHACCRNNISFFII